MTSPMPPAPDEPITPERDRSPDIASLRETRDLVEASRVEDFPLSHRKVVEIIDSLIATRALLAERDAEIARLREALSDLVLYAPDGWADASKGGVDARNSASEHNYLLQRAIEAAQLELTAIAPAATKGDGNV